MGINIKENYASPIENNGIVILPSVEDAIKLKAKVEELKRQAEAEAKNKAEADDAEFVEVSANEAQSSKETIPTDVQLMRTNVVLATSINSRYVKFQNLWLFIRDCFVTRRPGKYEWFALYAFLYKRGFIALDDKGKFSQQMCQQEWYGYLDARNKPTADAMGDYNYLLEIDHLKWSGTPIPMGNKIANPTGLSKLVNAYINLEVQYKSDDVLEPARR